jgi:hypothetical protein
MSLLNIGEPSVLAAVGPDPHMRDIAERIASPKSQKS